MVGCDGVSDAGLALAQQIAAATGCRAMADTSRITPRGQGRIVLDRVPYVVEVAVQAMKGTKHLILCGARKPVTFFAYPGKPQTSIPEDAQIHVLARRDQDPVDALARLADALGAPRVAAPDYGPRAEVGTRAADAGVVRNDRRRAAPGRRDRGRRVDHLRAGPFRLHQGLAAA